MSEDKNQQLEQVQEKLGVINGKVGTLLSNPFIKGAIFVCGGILMVKNIYQTTGMLIVYTMSDVLMVFVYGALLGVVLFLLWDTMFDYLNTLITRLFNN